MIPDRDCLWERFILAGRRLLYLFGLLTGTFSAAALHPLVDGTFEIAIAGPEEIPKQEEFRPRFDLLGTVVQWKVDGLPILTGIGLCDEFGMRRTPPGFDEAGIGDLFLKPGGGLLKKDKDGEYDFFHPYPVAAFLKTETLREVDRITFVQQIDNFHNFGYRYTKQYRWEKKHSRLVIQYELTNIGKKPLVTDQYNHNFFSFGKSLPGNSYQLHTDFSAKPIQRSGTWCDYRQRVFSGFHMIPPGCYLTSTTWIPAKENRCVLIHPNFPWSVEISGDFDSRKFAISFKDEEYISPEIFIEIRLNPGETRRWNRFYQLQRQETRQNFTLKHTCPNKLLKG